MRKARSLRLPDEPGMLAEVLAERMEECGTTIKDLAYELDVTYECVRRIVRGVSPTTPDKLRQICGVLELDYELVQRIADVEKLRRQYAPSELEQAVQIARHWERYRSAILGLYATRRRDVVLGSKKSARTQRRSGVSDHALP